MPEAFLRLTRQDRLDALGVAAERTRRPAYLLEKDVWVVWALEAMFSAPFGEHLVFKGGTSLSKVYNVIRRFSEDVDLTYDMRALAPGLVGDAEEPQPTSRSQASKWSNELRQKLAKWVAGDALAVVSTAISTSSLAATVAVDAGDPATLIVTYEPVSEAPEYIRPTVRLEFGARSTGEPATAYPVGCDAAGALPELVFPTASPRVMHAERTFWEKATAMHVFALTGKFRGGPRYARHWYDLMKLDDEGVADRALADRELANKVARHKADFFTEKDTSGQPISYFDAVGGCLRLVPEDAALIDLCRDYEGMVEAGLLLDDAMHFDEIIDRCKKLEGRANAPPNLLSSPSG